MTETTSSMTYAVEPLEIVTRLAAAMTEARLEGGVHAPDVVALTTRDGAPYGELRWLTGASHEGFRGPEAYGFRPTP